MLNSLLSGDFPRSDSSSATASRLATVNRSSKSSPSVKAASSAGLDPESALRACRASRLIGIALDSNSAPTRLAVNK